MFAARCCLVALFAVSASCARPPRPVAEPSNAVFGGKVSRNPNVISQEELQDPIIQSMSVMAAIRQLRPTFFRESGPQSFANLSAGIVQVSHDFGPLEPVGQLNGYDTLSLVEIRYLNIHEATNRFGINANGGPVIVLLSNKQP
jgi:hypothetical protein